jgi:hypothetical protein
MRQVEIVVTCDPCAAWKGAEVSEGVETVPVAGGQTLDLCPVHREGLREVIALIAEWGASPEPTRKRTRRAPEAAPARAGGPPPSPASEVNGKPRNRRGGKRARARREGAEAAVVEAAVERRPVCPLCARESASADALASHLSSVHSTTVGEVYGLLCPLCEHVPFASARALGSHGKVAHGVVGGVVALFDRAVDEGDPFGVVAARATSIVEAASE